MRRRQRHGVGTNAYGESILLMKFSLEALDITTKGVVSAVDVCICCKSRSGNVRKPATGALASEDNEDRNSKEERDGDHS